MAKKSRDSEQAGRTRPQSKFIVAVGDVVRHVRAKEFHEGAVLVRRIADEGDIDKLLAAVAYHSGGKAEALDAAALCLAREHCFYCAGDVRKCPFCNGTGWLEQTGTLCRACGGQALTDCQFCGDTGLASLEYIPRQFRGMAVKQRAIFAIQCLHEANKYYEQARAGGGDRHQIRNGARLAVSFSRRAKSILQESRANGARPEAKIAKLSSQSQMLLDKAIKWIEAAGRRKPRTGGQSR